MIFESHSHYDDEAFDQDRDLLLESMKDNNIEYVINVAASLKSVKTSLDLAHKYEHVYAAVGVHPSETEELNEENFGWMRQQALDSKCVAIGEIGFDYHWPEPGRDIQRTWFERQLLLAKELKKPVIIHSRDAASDTMDVLKSEAAKGIPGVMHCYSYTVETAKELLKMGYYFGIGGVITFSNAKKLVETVKYIPMENILLETDCPYLAPTPHRGERNSSLYLPLVADKIAQLKGITSEEVIEITHRNAERLFFGKE